MSALAEALLAAQRSACGVLGKAFVAGAIEDADLFEELDVIGLHDKIDQAHLAAALSVVKMYGGTLTPNGAKPPPESEPASEAQWKLLRTIAEERGKIAPDGPLTKAQASAAIDALKAGTYNADDYVAPF